MKYVSPDVLMTIRSVVSQFNYQGKDDPGKPLVLHEHHDNEEDGGSDQQHYEEDGSD